MAALLAAGLDGMERELAAGRCLRKATPMPALRHASIPKTLRDAIAALDGSSFLRGAFGDDVIDHYVRAGGGNSLNTTAW